MPDSASEVQDKLANLDFLALNEGDNRHVCAILAQDNMVHYGMTWTYVTQAVNGYALGLNALGYAYETANFWVAAGVFDRPVDGKRCLHLVSPVGCDVICSLVPLCRQLWDALGMPIYIKKVAPLTRSRLLSCPHFYDASAHPWHPRAALEDDTYAERVLSMADALRVLRQSSSEVANKLRRFARREADADLVWCDLEDTTLGAARSIVIDFFKYQGLGHIDISGPTDYENMLLYPPSSRGSHDVIRRVLFCRSQPVSLLILERIGNSDTIGVYCNLALYQEHRYLSEYVVTQAIGISHSLGMSHLNLGGSESEGLDLFKAKFGARSSEGSASWVYHSPLGRPAEP